MIVNKLSLTKAIYLTEYWDQLWTTLDLSHVDSASNVFLPINNPELYLRYRINFTGIIYDILEDKYEHFSLNSYARLFHPDKLSKKYNIRDLIILTFFRLPPNKFKCAVKDNGLQIRFPTNQKYDLDNPFIIANGVEFRKVPLEGTSTFVSRDGAVVSFDDKWAKVKIITGKERPSVYIGDKLYAVYRLIGEAWRSDTWFSKWVFAGESNWVFSFNDFLWIKDENEKYRTMQYFNVSPWLPKPPLDKEPQKLSIDRLNSIRNTTVKIDLTKPSTLKYFNRIAINGLYSRYKINVDGEIAEFKPHTTMKKGILARPFGYTFNNRDVDGLQYVFPATASMSEKIIDIGDIILWNEFRLTHESASFYYKVREANRYLDVYEFVILFKDIVLDESKDFLMIGTERFEQCNKPLHEHLYISKHGAVFNLKNHKFHRLYTMTNNKEVSIYIQTSDPVIECDILKLLTSAWLKEDLPKGMFIYHLSPIPITCGIYDIEYLSQLGYEWELERSNNPLAKHHLRIIQKMHKIESDIGTPFSTLRRSCHVFYTERE